MQAVGGHQQAREAWNIALACEMGKHLLHIAREGVIGGEIAQVGVNTRGARAVVAGGEMAVTLEAAAFAAGNQQHLGVGFEAYHAIHHLRAHGFELLGPVDVGLFIEAGFQFHQRGNLLAAAKSLAQQVDEHGRRTRAVNGLLNGDDLRIVDCFAQQVHHGVEAFKRLVRQHIALAHTRK